MDYKFIIEEDLKVLECEIHNHMIVGWKRVGHTNHYIEYGSVPQLNENRFYQAMILFETEEDIKDKEYYKQYS